MKTIALFILLAAAGLAPARSPDKGPFIYPNHLDQQGFTDLGLRFWFLAQPPSGMWMNWVKDDPSNPKGPKGLRPPALCVGQLGGSELPIYCVSAPTEREQELIVDGFLSGYRSGQGLAGPPAPPIPPQLQ
jgi:hypothetical protein